MEAAGYCPFYYGNYKNNKLVNVLIINSFAETK